MPLEVKLPGHSLGMAIALDLIIFIWIQNSVMSPKAIM